MYRVGEAERGEAEPVDLDGSRGSARGGHPLRAWTTLVRASLTGGTAPRVPRRIVVPAGRSWHFEAYSTKDAVSDCERSRTGRAERPSQAVITLGDAGDERSSADAGPVIAGAPAYAPLSIGVACPRHPRAARSSRPRWPRHEMRPAARAAA